VIPLANHLAKKEQPWHALQEQALSMTRSQNAASRESAFRLFAGTGMLGVGGWQVDTVIETLKGGLGDSESVDVSISLCFSQVFW
jgi:hypothetical protein